MPLCYRQDATTALLTSDGYALEEFQVTALMVLPTGAAVLETVVSEVTLTAVLL